MSLKIGVCLATLLASPAFASDWMVDDTISALDGTRTYAATILSNDTIRTATGDDERSTLVVRCVANLLEVYIVWPEQIGSGALEMHWRADGGTPLAEVWSVSRDGGATFSEDARQFLVNLKIAHRATFQLALANFDTLNASFNVAGADPVASTALSACKTPSR